MVERTKLLVTVAMFVLYAMGAIWHSLHPIMSVLSGHFRHPLTPFVDENAIDAGAFKSSSFPSQRRSSNSVPPSRDSLCQALAHAPKQQRRRIPCLSIRNQPNATQFQIAQLVPDQAPVVPKHEAMVLVVDGRWLLHVMVDFLHYLAQQPWLAKTLLVVAPPPIRDPTLKETVDDFLDWYLGVQSRSSSQGPPPIPSGWGGAMIRQLIVVGETSQGTDPKLLLLPTGTRGLMPNQDLFSTVFHTLGSSFVPSLIHVYPEPVKRHWVRDYVATLLPNNKKLQEWWELAWDYVTWEWSVATGRSPVAPHTTALERGIDALSIQAVNFVANNDDRNLRSLLGGLELALHALSNAHERLHHNTALYTLPRRHGNAYVKHEEFLIPTILLLLPLIVRAVLLVVLNNNNNNNNTKKEEKEEGKSKKKDTETEQSQQPLFHFGAAQLAVQTTLGGTALVSYGLDAVNQWVEGDDVTAGRVVVGAVYILLLAWLAIANPLKRAQGSNNKGARQSLQFVACLAALYLQLPMAFGYVALAFFSACFWTPLLAFPSWTTGDPTRLPSLLSRVVGWWLWGIMFVFLILTSPMVGLVPNVFGTFTVYVKYVYVPLHILACLLWLLPT